MASLFRNDPQWLRKSIKGSVSVQTASYLLLFGWYLLASVTSLYTQMKVVQLSAISLPENVLVYFIAADDGDVYRMNLATAEKRKVFDLKSTRANDRLFVQSRLRTAIGGTLWPVLRRKTNLMTRRKSPSNGISRYRLLRFGIARPLPLRKTWILGSILG